jgi:hypothetical protein
MSAASIPFPRGHLTDEMRALAASLIDPPERWRDLLEPVRAAFVEHRHATEGEEGLYADVVLDAPRLARMVDGLVAEHSELDTAIASLALAAHSTETDAETLRADAQRVIDGLARHRQLDSDLVYEAYTTDIGGE